MNNELEELKLAYLDAVRLYVWYSPSPHSFFQGKANKNLAAQYRVEAQVCWARYIERATGTRVQIV